MSFKQNFFRWWRSCFRVIKYSAIRYTGDQLIQQAIVLTYYTLFAIVPLLALVFGISKGFGLSFSLRELLIERFPAQEKLFHHICDLAEWALKQSSGGVVAGVGVVALLWTVVWLINNIEKAFNMVWGLPNRRNVLRKFSNYIALVLITPLLMVIVSTLGVAIRKHFTEYSEKFPDNIFMHRMLESAANVVPVLALILLFFVIYLRVPNTRVRWRGAAVAGVITGIGFQLLQWAFVFLQTWVFSYNRLYGGFAVLPLFLIWVNWSWQLILFGAEISFVQQHLKSGVFNEIKSDLSIRLRREHQLAIVKQIFSAFENGSGPVSESVVSASLRVPDVVLRSELGELLECGILCRSVSQDGEVFFLPGTPPDKFRVMNFLQILNGVGDSETPEIACFEKLFCRMEQSIENSHLNIIVHEAGKDNQDGQKLEN